MLVGGMSSMGADVFNFFNKVYQEKDEHGMLYFMYSEMNNAHLNGNFDFSDAVLKHQTELLISGDRWIRDHYIFGIGLLSITKPAAPKLTQRDSFTHEFKKLCIELRGEDETKKLLLGLT